MKPAIDELLYTVSEGDINHPVFGPRWSGEVSDEDFLLDVADYIEGLQKAKELWETGK